MEALKNKLNANLTREIAKEVYDTAGIMQLLSHQHMTDDHEDFPPIYDAPQDAGHDFSPFQQEAASRG